MHYVTTNIPYTGKADPCRKGEDLYCHGSCFVNDLPKDIDSGMRLLPKRIRAADETTDPPTHRMALVYMDTWLSSEIGAAVKYNDSAVLPAAALRPHRKRTGREQDARGTARQAADEQQVAPERQRVLE